MGLLIDNPASIIYVENAPEIFHSIIVPKTTQSIITYQPVKVTIERAPTKPITQYLVQICEIAKHTLCMAELIVNCIKDTPSLQRYIREDGVYEILRFQLEDSKKESVEQRIADSIMGGTAPISMLYNENTKDYTLVAECDEWLYNGHKTDFNKEIKLVDRQIRNNYFSYRLYLKQQDAQQEQ